ncbi:AraC family transcriptional regulator [Nocardioides sp. GXZ039]|uniref:AraC family transcriptional regulator n=1 Tax=Nocardioides sp. GXZ039 TaxID=3136018 RepID=UPI0030F3C197
MARVSTPLGSHGALHTTDIDDARASIAASLAPHDLTPLRDASAFHAQHNIAGLDRLSLHYIDYGSEVEVAAPELDFHLVQIPLSGHTTIRAAGTAATVGCRSATAVVPGVPVRMRYSAGNPRLMVRIEPDFVRERVSVAVSGGLDVTSQPADTFDLTAGVGRGWRSLIETVMADLERDDGLTSSPLVVASLEVAIVDGLLIALATRHDDDLPVPSASERPIRRAAQLIEEHCAEPLGTADIAEAVGLSIRALQSGFRTHLGTTPMAHLRRARLVRVRQALSDGSAESVTDAALACGVTHLGRLSSDYRAAFGETPSETLRRGQ